MKKTAFYVLIAFFIISSCKKDPPVTPGTNSDPVISQPNAMGLKIDGTLLLTDTISIHNYENNFSQLRVDNTGNGKSVELFILNNVPAGSYSFSADENSMPQVRYFDSSTYISNTGTLIVTSNDTIQNRIQGSFECTVKDNYTGITHQVTNGTFTINY